VYREEHRFTPGPLERAVGRTGTRDPNTVPETVCLTEDGILVGCLRSGTYHWSDDLGRSWQRLQGAEDHRPEVYQPWIHALPDGRITWAGHYGRDAPIRGEDRDDQYISLHLFRLEVLHRTLDTRLILERGFDSTARRWLNTYTLSLLCDDRPLADKELEFWYVERDQPGFVSHGKLDLEERMQMGGRLIRVRTGSDGKAQVDLSHLDAIEDRHHSIQLVARFNTDCSDPEYKPCQTCQFGFYSNACQDPPLGAYEGES
jgi:hypothetical protein